ncbi:uncharacterized protein [Coffea arabica]|uniref:Probable inactive serine/threonine-protein kinase bub1 isoform X1 n=1 Tax=Coffea arabica TaxID=13443 RepID=A0A6P6W602_COFAR|nr:probable inactive serine/threonine-protein kinase bub1 isoform X1 [Coffea arabica]XP_027104284.1 probable inactive serine/threonine-protein kinase bub1 isoform X1 [Coffea arabica]XP_027104285.1 probable inactive serine/threonine-protein kinase bub1 isoform X1 [Coffea arabica]XP_027104286.1 probable inactive serine/threonine-protein kinase bub1 isoform X1 [Coffea arabica]XP_027104287.1 probable inactive serine/threonine-protein kinase bub1 isoform X1 [Coffea arabica]XP_027110749.1 probable i
MSSSNNEYNDLFSSLISEIKNYTGRDPLLPWLRGIRKMKELVPPQLLKEKLPRFLQKCAQTFQSDRRYTNDLRYLRVWLQLMDFVDNPKSVLRTMEENRIGMKKSLFYQAYALYFEKMKKFEAAEKMYHLGVQNLAEPVDELQRSYEQFLHRMERHKNKKNRCQGRITSNVPLSSGICLKDYDRGRKESECLKPIGTWLVDDVKMLSQSSQHEMQAKDADDALAASDLSDAQVSSDSTLKRGVMGDIISRSYPEGTKAKSSDNLKHYTDDTVVVKFVDTAIVEQSDVEDARHHGLVEPTINTKEAMNAINNMFQEPLEPSQIGRRSRRNQSKTDTSLNSKLEIFVDGIIETSDVQSCQNLRGDSSLQTDSSRTHPPLQEQLQIFIDDEENENVTEMVTGMDIADRNKDQNSARGAKVSKEHLNGFVFPLPLDISLDGSCKILDAAKPQEVPVREETVYRFVGSTISDEPAVENVCHHGLVEPTINLKEAMDDINNMFGKPIEFVRKRRPKKKDETNYSRSNSSGFLILPDGDLDNELGKTIPKLSTNNENDLSEQTVCTREAIAEINKMFGMPLDF